MIQHTVRSKTILGLRQFLATESSLKLMKSAIYHLKNSFLSQYLFWLFGHVEKRLNQKEKANLKIHDNATVNKLLEYILYNI